jgi:cystathionine beta-lyase/cystathionine gamma-synthase
MSHHDVHFNTIAVHGAGKPDLSRVRPVSVPIFQSAEFVFDSAEHGAAVMAGQEPGYVYTRLGNPTSQEFEKRMALLEGAEDGVSFASGMAAISASILAFCQPGEAIISSAPIYGGTFGLFKDLLPRLRIKLIYLPAERIHQELGNYADGQARIVYLETPANPTLDIVDLEATIAQAKKHQLKVIVDNTFATPCLTRPMDLGADVVVHSATKYICGHGDTIGGVAVANKQNSQAIRTVAFKNLGSTIAPITAWLLARGLQTLPLRVERHCQNAMKIAKFLEKHPRVQRVCYPGLESCPGHVVAKKQMAGGFGGVLGIDVAGGREGGKRFQNNLKLCTLAVSLGSVETLVSHPASTTHVSYSEEELKKVGITPGFVRISVGLEEPEDIIADLDQALNKI